jgi:hypothetical protein
MFKLSGATQTLLTEGMGGRLKTSNGGLVPFRHRVKRHKTRNGQLTTLAERKSATHMKKRTGRIVARRTVAEQLVMTQRALAFELYRRTLRGRFNTAVARVKRLFGRVA